MDPEGLARAYVAAWLVGDPEAIASLVADDAVVTESHGPRFVGRGAVEEWARAWLDDGSTVDRWDITSLVADGEAAAFEWEFACTVEGKRHDISGATVLAARNGAITRLDEYRRTGDPTDGSAYYQASDGESP